MRRPISAILAMAMVFCAATARAEYKKFDIKYFMHEEIVNERYGEPVSVKQIRVHPIPEKKALYKINGSDWMILKFFSGRIWRITLLEDMDRGEARDILMRN